MLELIFEVNRRVYDKYYSADNSLVEQVYQLGEVDYFNVVTQSDDING